MEVATVISSFKKTTFLFDEFIYSFPLVFLTGKDNDTACFQDIANEKSRILYHYELVDPETEFSYNYLENEIAQIKDKYGLREIFMFDLSYRPEILLTKLLKAFKSYVKAHDNFILSDILISHPFDGLKSLDKDY